MRRTVATRLLILPLVLAAALLPSASVSGQLIPPPKTDVYVRECFPGHGCNVTNATSGCFPGADNTYLVECTEAKAMICLFKQRYYDPHCHGKPVSDWVLRSPCSGYDDHDGGDGYCQMDSGGGGMEGILFKCGKANYSIADCGDSQCLGCDGRDRQRPYGCDGNGVVFKAMPCPRLIGAQQFIAVDSDCSQPWSYAMTGFEWFASDGINMGSRHFACLPFHRHNDSAEVNVRN